MQKPPEGGNHIESVSAETPVLVDVIGNLSLGVLFSHALLEHLGKIDRVDQQRREAAITRCVGNDLACKREQHARAFDEQQWQHVFLREVGNPENAAIGQLDVENHRLAGFGLSVQCQYNVEFRLAQRIGVDVYIDVDLGSLFARAEGFWCTGFSKERSLMY